MGNEFQYIGVNVGFLLLSLSLQDGEARFIVGRLNIHQQPPFESGAKPLGQPGHFLRRAVTGNHNLAVGVVQLIKGMEKAFLGLFLAADELDVVNQQHAHAPVLIAEFLRPPLAYGRYELVGELLGADTDHPDMVAQRRLPDGVQEVGLAQAYSTIDKEGIIAAPRALGYRQGGGTSQAVAAAFNEGIEHIAWVKAGGAARGIALAR